MYYIALRMLFGDRAKYLLLVCSLSFACLLITQQASVFCGLMRWSTAILRNTKAKIWVVDSRVEQANETQAMRDIELQRVRSVEGVEWAMPMSFTLIQARLPNGRFKTVQLIGFDDTTLAGAPRDMLSGSFTNLTETNTVVIDLVGVEKLAEGYERPVHVGDTFEINDHEARVVGICKVERSFFGDPYVYTTYSRAREMRPKERRVLSYILTEPSAGKDPKAVARLIEKQTGLRAFTEDEFSLSTLVWFFENTGIPISFGTTVLLGFLVGVAVAGQTFYSFILENLPHFGAMKAMGTSDWMLTRMLMVQGLAVGFTGYGIGLGLATLFGYAVMHRGNPPFYLPSDLLYISLFSILFITTFSVFLGIRKINSVDPAQVFRG
ncbi:MAG: FtsX-like permease family protein [Verrucomicrobia bacterium]|nr:FtsX-like permease family protein [Verrucomicrobiota bacterium]